MANNSSTQALQRLIGFDFGKKRIGVATGQMVTQTARPLTTLQARDGTPNWDEVTKMFKKWMGKSKMVGYAF